MGRPSNTAERRAQIADALMRVMARRGYDGASVGQIAAAAALAPGLVHYHFASKREILTDLARRLGARLRARIARRAGAGPRRALAAFLDAHVALGPDADPDALACWVSVGAEALRHRDVRAVYVRVIRDELRELEALLRAVLAREGRSPRRAPLLAAGLFAAIQGCFQLGTAARAAVPRGFAAPALRAMADALIAREPRRKP